MTYEKIMAALKENGFVNEYGNLLPWKDDGLEVEEFLEDLFSQADEVTSYLVDIMNAFDSPGYDCYVVAASWIDNEGHHMEMFLAEN